MAEVKPVYVAEDEADRIVEQVLSLTSGETVEAIGYLLGRLDDAERKLNAIRRVVGAEPKKPFVEILRDDLKVRQNDG